MIENSKELLLKYIEEVWNKGRVDLIEKYAHPDYFAHGLRTDCFIEGHEGWWQLWKKWTILSIS